MNMNWSTLTDGKFYSSGVVVYDPMSTYFKDARLVQHAPPEFIAGLYDTVTLRNATYQYKEDDEAYLYVNDYS